jgi:hypothetical protein
MKQALIRAAEQFSGKFNQLLTDTIRVRDMSAGGKVTGQDAYGELIRSGHTYRTYNGSEQIPARLDAIRSLRPDMTHVSLLTATEFMLVVPNDFFIDGEDIVEFTKNGLTRYLQVRSLDDASEANIVNQYRVVEVSDADYD